jgi:hypothetical protein
MPWNSGQGKFIRINPDFSGETVWQQDQQATIKIIAARHDVHDQDIADGISDCLNLDGITAMRADLDMNSHLINNLLDGVSPTDAVNLSQLQTQDQDLKDYVDQEVSDAEILQTSEWLPASNQLSLKKGDGTSVDVQIQDFQTINSGGVIRHLSQVFGVGSGVVAFQTLSSSRWTLTNNGAATLNFEAPTGADPYLGEDYEVEGTVLVENGATPGPLTIQLNGSPVSVESILGSESLSANAKYLLSYVIHRHVGNDYDFLFIWSAV